MYATKVMAEADPVSRCMYVGAEEVTHMCNSPRGRPMVPSKSLQL
jgi:hypothetical protein